MVRFDKHRLLANERGAAALLLAAAASALLLTASLATTAYLKHLSASAGTSNLQALADQSRMSALEAVNRVMSSNAPAFQWNTTSNQWTPNTNVLGDSNYDVTVTNGSASSETSGPMAWSYTPGNSSGLAPKFHITFCGYPQDSGGSFSFKPSPASSCQGTPGAGYQTDVTVTSLVPTPMHVNALSDLIRAPLEAKSSGPATLGIPFNPPSCPGSKYASYSEPVDQIFRALLGRDPVTPGNSPWTSNDYNRLHYDSKGNASGWIIDVAQGTMSARDVEEQIKTSDEYLNRVSSSCGFTNAPWDQFVNSQGNWTAVGNPTKYPTEPQRSKAALYAEDVNALYRIFLGRFPDCSGLTYWVDKLMHGETLKSLIAEFKTSTEFVNSSQDNKLIHEEPVRELYLWLLGRDVGNGADDQGLFYWLALLADLPDQAQYDPTCATCPGGASCYTPNWCAQFTPSSYNSSFFASMEYNHKTVITPPLVYANATTTIDESSSKLYGPAQADLPSAPPQKNAIGQNLKMVGWFESWGPGDPQNNRCIDAAHLNCANLQTDGATVGTWLNNVIGQPDATARTASGKSYPATFSASWSEERPGLVFDGKSTGYDVSINPTNTKNPDLSIFVVAEMAAPSKGPNAMNGGAANAIVSFDTNKGGWNPAISAYQGYWNVELGDGTLGNCNVVLGGSGSCGTYFGYQNVLGGLPEDFSPNTPPKNWGLPFAVYTPVELDAVYNSSTGTVSFNRNGKDWGSSAFNFKNSNMGTLHIGYDVVSGGQQFFPGTIYAVLVYNTAVDALSRSQIQNYLSIKYEQIFGRPLPYHLVENGSGNSNNLGFRGSVEYAKNGGQISEDVVAEYRELRQDGQIPIDRMDIPRNELTRYSASGQPPFADPTFSPSGIPGINETPSMLQSLKYISQSIQAEVSANSSASFSQLSGCVVSPPLPICNIMATNAALVGTDSSGNSLANFTLSVGISSDFPTSTDVCTPSSTSFCHIPSANWSITNKGTTTLTAYRSPINQVNSNHFVYALPPEPYCPDGSAPVCPNSTSPSCSTGSSTPTVICPNGSPTCASGSPTCLLTSPMFASQNLTSQTLGPPGPTQFQSGLEFQNWTSNSCTFAGTPFTIQPSSKLACVEYVTRKLPKSSDSIYWTGNEGNMYYFANYYNSLYVWIGSGAPPAGDFQFVPPTNPNDNFSGGYSFSGDPTTASYSYLYDPGNNTSGRKPFYNPYGSSPAGIFSFDPEPIALYYNGSGPFEPISQYPFPSTSKDVASGATYVLDPSLQYWPKTANSNLYVLLSDPINVDTSTSPPTELPLAYFNGGVCGSNDCQCYFSALNTPLVVDMGNEGLKVNAHVFFDLGEGLEPTFWPSNPSSTMFLVWDRNGNGRIDDIGELFGVKTVGPDGKTATNGFEALKKYDENHDGLIDSRDAIYSQLRLWSDKNMNGRTDKGELVTLKEMKITAIDLHYSEVTKTLDHYGNTIHGEASVKLSSGETRPILDLWLSPSSPRIVKEFKELLKKKKASLKRDVVASVRKGERSVSGN